MIFLRSRSGLTVTSISLAVSIAHSAQAEKLSPEWQEQREYYNVLSEEACAGDRASYETLHDMAMSEWNPAAMNGLAWVYLTEECPYYHEDTDVAVGLQLESSKAGYPIATNNMAHRYMLGDGVKQNSQTALKYFERAISMGYGTSAIDLAHYYLDGDHLPVDYYRAVDLLRIAQETFENPDERPSASSIAELAQALDGADANIVGEQPVSQVERWRYEDNRASWGYVSDGRLRGEVFVDVDQEDGQIFFGLERVSNDPMIHFMGASVEASGGKKQELHFGKCGANNCLQLSSRDFATDTTYLSIPIIPAAQKATLEAMKSGQEITFRYQTRDSLAKNKFANFTLSLKGSRDAIEEVERLAAIVETRTPTPSVNPPPSSEVSQPEPVAIPVESAANTALGTPLVSCFYVTGSSLERPYVEKNMAKQEARLKEVNFYTLDDPIGTVVLSYMWGAIPTEINISKWKEVWMTIEQRDFYTDVTACAPGDFHYDTIEELVSGNLVKRGRNSGNDPKNRAAKNWQERIIRFSE